MNNLLNELNGFYKAIIKKLNNYRLTSIIVSAVSLLAGLLSLGLLFIYYFAGDISTLTESRQPSFVSLGESGRIMGMIFFLFCIFVIICSIVIIYNLLPYILNKEKLTPKKAPLMMAVVNGGLQIVVIVFSVLAIVLEKPNTYVWYIVTIPFNVITCIANFLCIVPFLKCVFYQPAIGSKLCASKEADK